MPARSPPPAKQPSEELKAFVLWAGTSHVSLWADEVFAYVLVFFSNRFNQECSLSSRSFAKVNLAAALADWR